MNGRIVAVQLCFFLSASPDLDDDDDDEEEEEGFDRDDGDGGDI